MTNDRNYASIEVGDEVKETNTLKDRININDYKDVIPATLVGQMELLDVEANSYQYWGHKYADCNESYLNSVVAFLFKHKEIKKPFWLVLFEGAQYKVNNTIFIQAFKNLPDLTDTIYEGNCIEESDVQKKDYEVIKNIVNEFNYLWFTGNETNNIEPLISNDSYALEDLANQIVENTHLTFNLKIPHHAVTAQTIENIKNLLEEAKQILYSQKSTNTKL